MKIISWEHAWVLFISTCAFATLRGTELFHPILWLLLYGVTMANRRAIRLERTTLPKD